MSTNNKKNMENLNKLLLQVSEYVDDPQKGLPEELFLFATEITPMVNVDLLIKDDDGRILLAWRKDRFYEEGWHVPGGIIRLKETFDERVQRVAETEIGCTDIIFNPQPIEVVPIICSEMKQRGHFISFIFECKLPDGFEIKNTVNENEAGYLKWHGTCPENILKVHEFYRKYWG